jgi:hypothetical protein
MAPTYRYSRRNPKPNSIGLHDTPGHRMGYTLRRDIFGPPKNHAYMPHCECGATCGDWFVSRTVAERMWHDKHVEAVKAQLALF